MEKPWRDPDTLVELYCEKDYTMSEIGTELGCSQATISKAFKDLGIKSRTAKESRERRGTTTGAPLHECHNEEWLRDCYHRRKMSLNDMAEEMGVTDATILRAMDRVGIERRPAYVTRVLQNPGAGFVHADARGYETIKHSVDDHTYNYTIHRLLAIAEWGYDEVCDSVVHHKSGIEWDNRPGNLELFDSQSDHAKHHHEERKLAEREKSV